MSNMTDTSTTSSPSASWRIRCLIAMMYDAPRAFEAKLMCVPRGKRSVSFTLYPKQSRLTTLDQTPSPDTPYYETREISIHRHIVVKQPSLYDTYEEVMTAYIGYDPLQNIIIVAE